MKGPVRTQQQVDKTQDAISLATGKHIEDEGLVRQELAQETETSNILARFGIDALGNGRQVQYGTTDHDLDLQTAIHATWEARDAFQRLPEHLRDKYKNWQNLAAAIEAGETIEQIEKTDTQEKTDAVAESTKQDLPGGSTRSGGNSGDGAAKP